MRFYFVAGAERTGAVSFVPEAETGSEPTETSLREGIEGLRNSEARLIVADFPALPSCAAFEALLRLQGFAIQSEVPDYYADGVAMRILVMHVAENR